MEPYHQEDGITIYHGDCFDVLHSLQNIGAVVTDPPYSSGGLTRGDRMQSTVAKYVQNGTLAYRPEFAGDNRDQRSFAVWCAMWMMACRNACHVGAPIVCWTDWRQLPTMTDAVQCAGWTWRNIGTWWKPGVRMQKGRFSGSAEYIVYGTNGPADEGAESPQNVIDTRNDPEEPPVENVVVSAIEKEKLHLAEKPQRVMRWCLSVVPEGAVVLDPFMGCGSTLRAAKDMGLEAIGIDVDERYCEQAVLKLQQGVLF